ncbi:MAG: hypothetical protein PHC68_02700 [Syntrophorhabdaceae bacterium]|jgi:hypothetical protein|nr:hypothetical protein [Syntrophorhabdaceae bacterium]
MKTKIRQAQTMCLKEYGAKVKIEMNDDGFDITVDRPIYYKAQFRMIQDIKDIIGPYSNTGIYTA